MGTLLNSAEHVFFDNVALEVLRLAGTPDPILWKFYKILPPSLLSSVSGQIDCIYEDPGNGSKHYIPFGTATGNPVLCYFEKPDALTDVNDNGLVQRFEGRIWFSRKNLENLKVPLDDDANHMSPGDIIQLWSKNKVRSWYFEVIRAEREGFENDSDVFTHYACDVVRNDNFIPERKIVK